MTRSNECRSKRRPANTRPMKTAKFFVHWRGRSEVSSAERRAMLPTSGMKAGVSANKSEILRAGLAALDEMSDRELAQAFRRLVRVKTGRPVTKGE